ncbi:MAG TPA: ROK family protein, partial [Anaerolineaceae bacterium]|nr:ROK family protein [Anaerolineaceae bacterium]
MEILGVDIGGSGIKAAPVDVETGAMTAQRFRLPTPELASPAEVAHIVDKLVDHFAWKGPIGCGFPAVVHHGVVYSAANIAKEWIGVNGENLL